MTILTQIPHFFGISIEVYLITILFGITIYFLLNRILRKRIQEKKKRKVFVIIGTLILAPTFYLIVAFVFISVVLFPPEFQKDFDQKTWSNLKELRFEMRDDIVESGLLQDIEKSEVIRILGKPERGDSTDIWVYDLGVSQAGFGWQFNDLQVHFENDNVKRVEVIETVD